jgi:hypothetical protein
MKRALLVVLVVAATALLGATGAWGCGKNGYSYAGISAPSTAFGIAATVTPLAGFNVRAGHVAGWVGVGGPGLGPNGSDEWLQVGLSGFPGTIGNDAYYELTLPTRAPTYHRIAAHMPTGSPARFAVLEMRGRPSWWRVWFNGSPVTKPILLPGSHGMWAPIATAESWDGGTHGQCNDFLYRFQEVSVAYAPGGRWQQLRVASEITSASTRVRRSSAAFWAAEGSEALRALASVRR